MKIINLFLVNYRNHEQYKLELDSDTILIVGDNGMGKTNILEAIHLLSTGKPHRGRYDREIIKYEQHSCTIHSKILTEEDELELALQIITRRDSENASTKKVTINKVPKSINYFTGVFNSVLFAPESINLITGSPSDRRKYMNSVLVQVDKDYKKHLNSYERAVRQRNKVLERINEENKGWNQINYWDDEIIIMGCSIQEKREKLLRELEKSLDKYFKQIDSSKTKMEIDYQKKEVSKEILKDVRKREVAARTTLVGPHREDFVICSNGRSAGVYSSRGQQRSTILALKLAELDYIQKEKGERPVLLLDDIFSELDRKHQKAVLDTVGKQQTIITDTHVPHSIKDNGFTLVELE